jgi:hypothetical protein
MISSRASLARSVQLSLRRAEMPQISDLRELQLPRACPTHRSPLLLGWASAWQQPFHYGQQTRSYDLVPARIHVQAVEPPRCAVVAHTRPDKGRAISLRDYIPWLIIEPAQDGPNLPGPKPRQYGVDVPSDEIRRASSAQIVVAALNDDDLRTGRDHRVQASEHAASCVSTDPCI